MFLNAQLLQEIQLVLPGKKGVGEQLKVLETVSGGSINDCYKLGAGNDLYFLKVNNAAKFPGMFLAEMEGLKRIAQTATIAVPNVIACGRSDDEQYLLMGWISSDTSGENLHEKLGRKLGAMHHHNASKFGLDHNNYMGSLHQSNTEHNNWTDFFINERLEPQLKMASDSKKADSRIREEFNSLYTKLEHLYPLEKPCLVHGDLWNGNYMVSEQPVLIDPAIAYAHREVDIAMTLLFGGFSKVFYEAYNDFYPLEKGWQERADLWNLYPLLVHLNLFGAGYLPQIQRALKTFT